MSPSLFVSYCLFTLYRCSAPSLMQIPLYVHGWHGRSCVFFLFELAYPFDQMTDHQQKENVEPVTDMPSRRL